MCPVCWISGFIALLFGGSFIAVVNHPISLILGVLIVGYGVYKLYDGYKRGKTINESAKNQNKKLIYRFIQGVVIGSLVTGILFFNFTAEHHNKHETHEH